MLQRMVEDLLYSNLLTQAAQCSSTMEEAACVAAFINSAYAITIVRVGKPFNPLLFETYECDRRADPDHGWRAITEQVCLVNVCGLMANMSSLSLSGQSSPSNVCYARGTQRLDILARVHRSIQVSWQVHRVLSSRFLSFGNARY